MAATAAADGVASVRPPRRDLAGISAIGCAARNEAAGARRARRARAFSDGDGATLNEMARTIPVLVGVTAAAAATAAAIGLWSARGDITSSACGLSECETMTLAVGSVAESISSLSV
jgi:hypothetical protein